jgi:ribosomal protein S27AE
MTTDVGANNVHSHFSSSREQMCETVKNMKPTVSTTMATSWDCLHAEEIDRMGRFARTAVVVCYRCGESVLIAPHEDDGESDSCDEDDDSEAI